MKKYVPNSNLLLGTSLGNDIEMTPQASDHEVKAYVTGTVVILVSLCPVILKCHFVSIKNRHTKVTPKVTSSKNK